MTEYASIEDLTADQQGEEDLTLSSGRTVRIRPYTRYELILFGKNTEDVSLIERRMLVACMVQPALTASQAEAWQKSSRPKDIGEVVNAIRELSGMGEGAAKSDLDAAGD